MIDGIPPITSSVLKRLALAVSQGTLTYEMLVAEAATQGVTLGELVWGIIAEMGGTGAAASRAKQIWNGIKGLTQFAELRAAATAAESALVVAEAAPLVETTGLVAGGIATLARVGLVVGVEGAVAGPAVGAAIVLAGIYAIYWVGSALLGAVTTSDQNVADTFAITAAQACIQLQDDSNAYDADWNWFSPITGAGGHNRELNGYICHDNGYYIQSGNAFSSYSCDANWSCSPDNSFNARITDQIAKDDGSTDYYYQTSSGSIGWGNRKVR